LVPDFSTAVARVPCEPANLEVPPGFAPTLAVGTIGDNATVLAEGFLFASPFRFHFLTEHGVTTMRARPFQADSDGAWVWIAFELNESSEYAGGVIRYARDPESSGVRGETIQMSLIPSGSPFPTNASDTVENSVRVNGSDACETLVSDFQASIDALKLEYSLYAPDTGLKLQVFELSDLAFPAPGMKHHRVAFYGRESLEQVEVISFVDNNRDKRASIRIRTPNGEEVAADIDCENANDCTATMGPEPSEYAVAQVEREAQEGTVYSCRVEWIQEAPL
jgi:hypothetical protein